MGKKNRAPPQRSMAAAIGAAVLLAAMAFPLRAQVAKPPPAGQLDEIQVTAERLGLLGTAGTASEGIVVDEELALTPAFRVGQLLETIPGLQVTSHSGEGKANQYLLRGYNLDHGTDLATFVDGMPVNEPTHTHGQGYTDLNFLIPELATHIAYTKGPYHAEEGDFSSVGSVHIEYLDRIDTEVSLTGGTLGYERIFTGGSTDVADGAMLGAMELQHYDGPWVNPDDFRKINAVLRYSRGDDTNGLSLTAMHYQGSWNATTDQPQRAVDQSLISRYGSLDPSDGGDAQRTSLTAQYSKSLRDGQLRANLYAFNNRLTLWNDFTHFLIDPINGDQEAQHEERNTAGGGVSYRRAAPVFGFENSVLLGFDTRNDFIEVTRFPTQRRQAIPAAHAPTGFSEADHVRLDALSGYAQTATRWNDWFRSVFGLRYDAIIGGDTGTNSGTAAGHLLAPKGSLIFRPLTSTELYLSAGRGFHSDDLRGVTAAPGTGVPSAPLIARQSGEEVGVRQQITPAFTLTFALYTLSAESETSYNPDIGMDFAGPASRRRGYEVNATYQAARWLEFYASYSGDHARYATTYDDGTGHPGLYLPNAPFATGSFNVYLKDLGAWSGSLGYRYLSAYPLSPDNAIQGHGYGEWSGDAHYLFKHRWTAAMGVYNIAAKKADAAEFWYIDRLRGEPDAGIAGVHVHPLEGRTVRLTLQKSF